MLLGCAKNTDTPEVRPHRLKKGAAVNPEQQGLPRAEEALRLLASAVSAVRLYPPASSLPAEAVARFTARACDVAAQGPIRFRIDPDGFRLGDMGVAAGNSQVGALARSLHAMQAGMLIIAPGLSDEETAAFIVLANSDPRSVRAEGGPRTLLAAAGVTHIAVVEVSLKSSDESGLLGLDLMSAPLEDIAEELTRSAERWAAATDVGQDDVAMAIDRLEAATREMALDRVSQALMRLDEPTRMRVLGFSLKADSNGQRMDGALDVIAHMKPAALARLLSLVAAQADTDPRRIAAALPLPPETMKLLSMMLGEPVAQDAVPDAALGVPTAEDLAAEMAVPLDAADLTRQLAGASPLLASGRALATAVAISRDHPDSDSVFAIGASLPQAARDGAFSTVREALRRLDELGADPSLAAGIGLTRSTLIDPQLLREVCDAVHSDSDAAIVGEILLSAGPTGAEALLDSYVTADAETRSLLRPVLRSMAEPILGVARSRVRNESPAHAVEILHALGALGDRRAVPAISQGLAHLDEQVRFAAITALADSPEPEAVAALAKALGHSEPETQRFAVREIGRVRAAPTVHQLTRVLEDLNVLQRTHEIKKEVIRALEQIGTPEAQRALKRTADRRFIWGRKTRELRSQARAALRGLGQARGDHTKGVSTP